MKILCLVFIDEKLSSDEVLRMSKRYPINDLSRIEYTV
jgi:hypothetical protein